MVGKPSKKIGILNPNMIGKRNKAVLCKVTTLSRHINVPKNPPIINTPCWLTGMSEGIGIPQPSRTQPPQIPKIKENIAKGRIYKIGYFMGSLN
jgi:hypothetical protein